MKNICRDGGARPHDGVRDSAGSRHGEWDSQICDHKREEEGRLGKNQEKEELKQAAQTQTLFPHAHTGIGRGTSCCSKLIGRHSTIAEVL